MTNAPADKLRRGALWVTIQGNHSDKGNWCSVKRDRGDRAADSWRETDNLGHDDRPRCRPRRAPGPTPGHHQPEADGGAQGSSSGTGRGNSRDNSLTVMRLRGNWKRARLN